MLSQANSFQIDFNLHPYTEGRHPRGSFRLRLLSLRFGWDQNGGGDGDEPMPPVAVARALGTDIETVTKMVRHEVRDVPLQPEAVPLDVIYEDEAVLAVNKPAGVMTYPAHRLRGGSVVARAVHHLGPGHRGEPSPAHRLDLGTSGVLVLAKDKNSAKQLMSAFEARAVSKKYLAICRVRDDGRGGCTVGVGEAVTVDANIGDPPADLQPVQSDTSQTAGRPGQRAARVICAEGGKPAQTRVEVLARVERTDGEWALVRAEPLQGRTHQVRIHLAHAGLPIAGDSLYGGPQWLKRSLTTCEAEEAPPGGEGRFALHAWRLDVMHPRTSRPLELTAPLPSDMRSLTEDLNLHLPEYLCAEERPAGASIHSG